MGFMLYVAPLHQFVNGISYSLAVSPFRHSNGAFDFHSDLSEWDVSRVQDFTAMFQYSVSFRGNITSWNMESATSLGSMFAFTESFSSEIADLSGWNVERVTDLSAMFAYSTQFNGDISSWQVGNVETMAGFAFASSFDQDLCAWGALLGPNVLVADAFAQSRCEAREDPTLNASPPGPFCKVCT